MDINRVLVKAAMVGVWRTINGVVDDCWLKMLNVVEYKMMSSERWSLLVISGELVYENEELSFFDEPWCLVEVSVRSWWCPFNLSILPILHV